MLGNCHKSDIVGLSALRYLNELPGHYRLNEFGDDIGMDKWTMSAKTKRDTNMWTLRQNALRSKKDRKKFKLEMKAIINNLEFPKDEADAQIAPSIYNMPLEKAVEGPLKGNYQKNWSLQRTKF